MKQVTLLLRSFLHRVFCVKAMTRAGLGGLLEEPAAAAVVCLQPHHARLCAVPRSLLSVSSQRTSAPQQARCSSLLNPREGGARDLCTLHFLWALKKAVEGKLRHSQKPPSVSLFIRAGKAVYSVSVWKLHWDHGLIVLFVELIALFDQPASHNTWEWDIFAVMWEWKVLNLFLPGRRIPTNMQEGLF